MAIGLRVMLAVGLLVPLAVGAEEATREETDAAFLEGCREGEGIYGPVGECEETLERARAIRRMREAEAAVKKGASTSEAAEEYGLSDQELLELELEQARMAAEQE
jgi:hypothetical protein